MDGMISVSNALQDVQPLPHHREMVERTLNKVFSNQLVKEFLMAHDLQREDEIVQRNITRLLEYWRVITRTADNYDKWYQVEMALVNNNIELIYRPRSEAMAYRMQAGERMMATAVYDETTRTFKDAVIGKTDVTTEMVEAVTYIKNFIANYKHDEKNLGMWLVGQMGVGKTHLMGFLSQRLIDKDIGVTFINVGVMFRTIKEKMNLDSRSLIREVDKIKKSEVLILDDIGTETPSNWSVKEVLYAILNYRMEHGKATFFTSNLTKHDYLDQLRMGRDVLPMDVTRLGERLDSLAKEIQMGGKNRRIKI